MSSERPGVLVVDDSALIREILTDLLEASGEFRVVGTAVDGMDAIRKVHALDPDLVTLDVRMPVLDGLQALGFIMREAPRPVVMLSALDSPAGGELTIRALELGAVEFVRKAAPGEHLDKGEMRDRLLAALRSAAAANLRAAAALVQPHHAVHRAAPRQVPAEVVVAIAASTGGPRALAEIIPHLPATLGAAVLIVQHMPNGFTESLARRLDGLAALPVSEARQGEVILSGHAYVAAGGRHLRVTRQDGTPMLEVTDDAPVWGMRPSADVLFRSVATCFGASAVGVVLTGMGRDGAEGLRVMRQAGARAVVQDAASSAVPGMPSFARAVAGADAVCPLGEVSVAIVSAVGSRGEPSRTSAIPGADVTTWRPPLS